MLIQAIHFPGVQALEFVRIDDPVGAFPVHYCGGLWGMIAVGMFAEGRGVSINLEYSGEVMGNCWVTTYLLVWQ